MADRAGLVDLSGKVGLVPGGSRGLERAMATTGAGLGVHGGAA